LLLSRLLAAATPEEELLAKIRRNKIDPAAVYRVRELPLTRDAVRFYFNEGVIALLEPINGRVTGAIFVGEGETLVMPPDTAEKRNLAHFTGTPVLNEKFSAAYLRFSDDTAAQLTAAIKEHTVPPQTFSVPEFVDEWSPVAQNLNLISDLRLLDDLLIAATPQPDQAGRGFFIAHCFGQRIGTFDIAVDPLAPEPVSVGQVNWKDGKRYIDLWLSFLSKSPPPKGDPFKLGAYRIDANIAVDRQMEMTAVVELDTAESGERMVSFQLSRFLRVSSVESEGVKLQVYQNEGDPQRGNDAITLLFPKPLEKGKHYTLTFHYAGSVIADAGHGVLFVGARGIWYPQRGYRPALFDLTFRFPRKLSLAATGDRIDQREEGDWRISHWKTQAPIRMAGFNVGNYEEGQAKTADGVTIIIYANRELEPALERTRLPTVTTVPAGAGTFPNRRATTTVTPAPPPPSAASVASQMAHEISQVVDFFAKTFGPLPFSNLRVSPIPGAFGQGWPGLIYLSTTSYLVPYDAASKAGDDTTLFFSSLLPVHEVAHQWWGQAVIPGSYRDEWITEALATYSALLWLEQKDRVGPHNVRTVLRKYRDELLVKHDDETAESVGPLVLGQRLNNSRTPNGSEHILYDKGPWVIHMLRQLMRDPKTGSDAAFFRFLRALREEYSTRPLTTAGFRELAEKYVEPQMNAEEGNKGHTLEWFFEQWVSGSGIPEVHVEAKLDSKTSAKLKPGAPPSPGRIAGTATLENVEETWVLPVPLFVVQSAHGEVFAGTAVAWANGNAEDSRFSIKLTAPAQKILIDPQQSLLAVYK
jgi:hypothetical protein